MFLVACFRLFGLEHYTAVMYAQGVVDLVTCLLVGALAGRLFGRKAGFAALWLAALCPFTASYVAYPLAETLTLTCVALAFYGLERWRAAWLGFNRVALGGYGGAGLFGAAAARARAACGGGCSGDALDGTR